MTDIRDLVSYDWNKLILLNLGYNSIGNEGMKMVTTVRWPNLKTLYLCTTVLFEALTTFSRSSGFLETFVS